jgi:hypothetical protein
MKIAQTSLGLMVLLTMSSCTSCLFPSLLPEDKQAISTIKQQIKALPKDKSIESDNYEISSYEYFVSHLYYLETAVAYRDEALMAKADASCPVYICLSQQRGRLYVDGKVALDWPVSTGKENTPTSRGRFVILEKKKEHLILMKDRVQSLNASIIEGTFDIALLNDAFAKYKTKADEILNKFKLKVAMGDKLSLDEQAIKSFYETLIGYMQTVIATFS